MPDQKKRICLNMIVKDETKVIRRCLESAKPLIDYWVIVDTGSTDGTQEMIREFMKDIPGELYERPWKNFGHNRNEALQLAKGKADYILFIDADDFFRIDPGFSMPDLKADSYLVPIEHGGMSHNRVQLIRDKDSLNWKWVGVLHEAISSSEPHSAEILKGVTIVISAGGFRSTDPQKFHKDAKVLEEALLEEPNNTRYVFYLAQSYRDAGELELALKNYEKRVAMGGWEQEVFWSKLQSGMLQERLKMDPKTFVKTYYDAYHYRPTRAEPFFYLANYYRRSGNYAPGYLIASIGRKIPFPDDILFVDRWIYDYGLELEYAICAYWIGEYEESKKACLNMLAQPKIPANFRECAKRNLNFAEAKLAQIAKNKPLSKEEKAILQEQPL